MKLTLQYDSINHCGFTTQKVVANIEKKLLK